MSGVINLQRRWFGFSPEGRGERSKVQNDLGKNDRPYYGTAVQTMLGDVKPGSPKGARMVRSYIESQGTPVSRGRTKSASAQLLGD